MWIPNAARRDWYTGQDATFTCRVQGISNQAIRWLRQDGKPLPRRSRVNNGVLYLFDLQPQHSGVYICRATGDEIPTGIDSNIVIGVKGIKTYYINTFTYHDA